MTRIILLGLVLLFCFNFNCCGQTSDTPAAGNTPKQYYLVLGKPIKTKIFRFYQGNTITFKLPGSKDYYTGEITAIHQNAIVFWQTDIKLHDIEKIRITNETRTQKVTGAVSAISGEVVSCLCWWALAILYWYQEANRTVPKPWLVRWHYTARARLYDRYKSEIIKQPAAGS